MVFQLGLEDQLVVITGSTAGIGKGIAEAFAKAGATVVINGRRQETVSAAIDDIKEKQSDAKLLPIIGDCGTSEGTEEFCKQVDALGRPVDVLICNVGIFDVEEFWDITDAEWIRYLETNFLSNVRLCRHYLKPMLDRKEGRILLIASEAGLRVLPHMLHYSITKTAQIAFAEGLAQLTKGTNVTVNSVLAGPTWTGGVQGYMAGLAAQKGTTTEEATAAYFKEVEPNSLLQRFLTVEEIANAVVFLGSKASSGINGTAYRVDGGIIRHI